MNLVYRKAEESDAEKLIDFLKCAGGETDFLSYSRETFDISVESEARFIRKFKNDKKSLMLVAEDNGKIVANASIEKNRVRRCAHRAELSVVVLKDYWGFGIGKELITRLIDYAKEAELQILELDVRSDNERAISLYRKFGFKEHGYYKRFFKIDKNYHDAILMSLEL